MDRLTNTIQAIGDIERNLEPQLRSHLDSLTKPPGSLGKLEDIAVRYGMITGTVRPSIGKKRIVVFAGDHGVAQEGVSAFPGEVTPQMVRNMLNGGAAVNVLARHIGAGVQVVDIGVNDPLKGAKGLLRNKVRSGTRNIAREPAMTIDEAVDAITAGINLAKQAANDGVTLLGTGEMGIANTTPSSALFAALFDCPVEEITGRGTGIDDARLEHKRAVIRHAVDLHKNRLSQPLDALAALGGLENKDRERIKGIIINRFRGDPDLFSDGITYIERKTGLPVLGLVPYFHNIDIDSEDGVILEKTVDSSKTFQNDKVNIAVVKLPHISNFTDFNVLQRDDSINLQYLSISKPLDAFDLVILPGKKNVRFDIKWLRERGWEQYFRSYIANRGILSGICGGYQMLGTLISDPHGVEGPPGDTPGFGFLEIETELNTEKVITRVSGIWLGNGEPIEGYEIHMGKTTRNEALSPVARIVSRNGEPVELFDGTVSKNGMVWGCYIHGLFDDPGFRRTLLKKLRPDGILCAVDENNESLGLFKDHQYDLLAKHFTSHLDVSLLWEIIGLNL